MEVNRFQTLQEKTTSNLTQTVFCGKYVTPVEEDYFEHLDRVRGKSKKLKMIANAREAVVRGFADAKELQMAALGAQVASNGDVIPAPVNGQPQRPVQGAEGPEQVGENGQPRGQMDIALHNFGDYPRH